MIRVDYTEPFWKVSWSGTLVFRRRERESAISVAIAFAEEKQKPIRIYQQKEDPWALRSAAKMNNVVAESILCYLAKLLSSKQLAQSSEMKASLRNRKTYAAHRSHETSRIIDAARRYGAPIAGKRVLDLGCSGGFSASEYSRAGAASVVGLDIDSQAIEVARRTYPHLEFAISSVSSLPLPDASIDTILAFDVFEHVAKVDTMLSECRRVLAPGGVLLLGTWGWYHPFAPHLWSVMPVPWAHVVVSERTLLRACRKVYHSAWYQPMMHDFDADGDRLPDKYTAESIPTDYLNKFLLRDFEHSFERSGMLWQIFPVGFSHRFARWAAFLTRAPFVREFVTAYFWATLRKPLVVSESR